MKRQKGTRWKVSYCGQQVDIVNAPTGKTAIASVRRKEWWTVEPADMERKNKRSNFKV